MASAPPRRASSSGSMGFSSAVSAGRSWNDWNTNPTERPRKAARASSSIEKMSTPSSSILPELGVSSPARIASSVDFPDPEAPTIATASPGVTARSISRRMTRPLVPLFTTLPMPRAIRTLLFSMLFAVAVGAPAAPERSILVYGDSLSAAYGIAQTPGWGALLEERLKREQPDYIVVNASISGETTAGGLARIGKALAQHRPRVVILELGANDGFWGPAGAGKKKKISGVIGETQKN